MFKYCDCSAIPTGKYTVTIAVKNWVPYLTNKTLLTSKSEVMLKKKTMADSARFDGKNSDAKNAK